jgi:hypothetical protein
MLTYRSWGRRRLDRARVKGGWHVFWFYMSLGLVWGMFLLATISLVEYFYDGTLDAKSFQRNAGIYFVAGLLYGLLMWILQEASGASRLDKRP